MAQTHRRFFCMTLASLGVFSITGSCSSDMLRKHIARVSIQARATLEHVQQTCNDDAAIVHQLAFICRALEQYAARPDALPDDPLSCADIAEQLKHHEVVLTKLAGMHEHEVCLFDATSWYAALPPTAGWREYYLVTQTYLSALIKHPHTPATACLYAGAGYLLTMAPAQPALHCCLISTLLGICSLVCACAESLTIAYDIQAVDG